MQFSMRAEVLRQCKNAAPEGDGSIPRETAALRLYMQPNPITTKESLIDWWNNLLPERSGQVILYGDKRAKAARLFSKRAASSRNNSGLGSK
jgi:hypothetical protein